MKFETCLGRHVKTWYEYHGDVILKMLYDYYLNVADFDKQPLAISTIISGTSLNIEEIKCVIAFLCGKGFVSANDDFTQIKITNDGELFVGQFLQ